MKCSWCGNEIQSEPFSRVSQYPLTWGNGDVEVDISLSPDDSKVIERAKFDLEYLKAHEVKNIPKHLQKWLFKPGGV
jgi:hypothetical protein